MNEQNAFRLGALILLGMAVQLIVIGYVFYTDYRARTLLADSARFGCERDRVSRTANAQGWRIAQDARAAEGEYGVAARYALIATRLETAADIDCNKEHPKVGFIP